MVHLVKSSLVGLLALSGFASARPEVAAPNGNRKNKNHDHNNYHDNQSKCSQNCLDGLARNNAIQIVEFLKRDCSSFQATTVTPCSTDIVTLQDTIYAYETKTSTVFDVLTIRQPQFEFSREIVTTVKKREVAGITFIPSTCTTVVDVPTEVPGYAWPCTDAEEYASACACNGVRKSIITAAPSIAVQTVRLEAATVTQTVTAEEPTTQITGVTVILDTSLPTQTCQMILQASGGTVDGRYINADTALNANVISPAQTPLPDIYRLDGARTGFVYVARGPLEDQLLYLSQGDPVVRIAADEDIGSTEGAAPIFCTVDSLTWEMTCQIDNVADPLLWQDGPSVDTGNYLYLDPSVQSGSTQFTMQVVPIDCVSNET